MVAARQHNPDNNSDDFPGHGLTVDALGRPAIDPTKNVLAWVNAESKYQDAMRDAESRRQDGLRDAETRRINELAAEKLTFDLELAKILRANQDAAALLLATQLREVKNDLSDRMAKQEQFRWESGGKSQGIGMIGAIVVGAAVVVGGAIAFLGFAVSHAPIH
jgi:hypothetical protein